ncbi:hypothetical protein [Paenibacillus sp. GP183]|jgi:hypothetical protein|uniref:hypothetical protein n=1 Tax=Paenibacillus sp. GP183 TaxID=1882751 RepID=UPI0008994B78|nr:hypothetical protein [Paenibacillus sp. GP183]SEB79598.1 hypothetical protein SAMN05443246_1934 [Paenibacillus sp. GP183]
MKSKLLKASAFAVMLVITGGVVVSMLNNDTLASIPSPAANGSATLVKATQVNMGMNGHATTRHGRFQSNVVGEAAAILGVKPIWILDEMKKGLTLVKIAEEEGLNQNEFLEQLTELETRNINEAVESGQIPQKHADALLEGMADRLSKALEIKAVDVNDPHNPGMSM